MVDRCGNIFAMPLEAPGPEEFFEDLLVDPSSGVRVERIISHGHSTGDGEWLCQAEAEWVVLVQGAATLVFEDTGEQVDLGAGDWIYIAPLRRHRVVSTSVEPPCVWLAVHGVGRGS